MNNYIEVSGIITTESDVGDYDRRIVILTKEIGRISAFANYARTSKSRFRGSTREFICAKFRLHRTKDSFTVIDIDVLNYFTNIISNMDKTAYATYFCEVVNYYTRENSNEKEVLKLLYRTFQAIESSEMSLELIRAIFELKMLVLEGEYPSFKKFVDTQNTIDVRNEYNFSISNNGLVEKGGTRISKNTLYTIIYVIDSNIGNLFDFKLSPTIENEYIEIVKKYFASKTDIKFKSLQAFNWRDKIEEMKKGLVRNKND